MSSVSSTRNLNLPAERVWEALADFTNVQRFHPFVKTTDKLSDNDRGLGAVRRCNFYDDGEAVEEITDWREGEGYTLEVKASSMPLKKATATLGVRPIDDASSAVTIEMDFIPKFGLVGRIMAPLMMKPMMRKMFANVLSGLERHVTTGEEIGDSVE